MQVQNSIRKKLTWIIVLATSLVSLMGYSIFINWYIHSQQKQNIILSKELSQTLSQDIAKLILLDDLRSASNLTSALGSFKSIDKVIIYNKKKTAIYKYQKNKAKDSFTYITKAIYDSQELGSIEFKLKKESLLTLLKKDLPLFIITYLFSLILSYFIATYFAKHFTQPLLKLVSFLKNIELDNLTKRVSTTETNEYGLLYKYTNEMLDRIQQAQDEQRLAAIAFETQAGMAITDKNEKILRINKAFSEITGYTEDEVIGKTPTILKSDKHTNEFYKHMKIALKRNNYWSGEIYNKHKNGKIFPEHLTIQSVLDNNKEVKYYISSFIDISTQKEAEAKLTFLQQYDNLTGLPNKELFLKIFQKFLNSAEHNHYGSLICFNIRDFKIINDTYGYETGDLLLQEVAQRIQKKLGNSKTVAKIGLDEYIICSKNIAKSKKQAEITTQDLAEYISILVKEPFIINGSYIHINIYIGIEIYNQHKKDAKSILTKADTALSQAKVNNKELAFFDKQIEEQMSSRLNTYSELIYALKHNEFELYYQLQYDQKQQVYAAEALIRWNHTKKGLIPPDMFIPLAEKTGLIIDIGDFVIEEGCKQLQKWHQNKKTQKWILAVNVSAKQFHQDNFIHKLENTLKRHNFNKDRLKIELTESLLAENLEAVQKKMQHIRSLGIQISLDDFGTGYSSLQYLKTLPLNQVKIDQNFVMNMLKDKRDFAIIEAVIKLGETFGFEVIAEGVETKEIYEALLKLHCYHFQGYYFARPEPIEKINQKYKL